MSSLNRKELGQSTVVYCPQGRLDGESSEGFYNSIVEGEEEAIRIRLLIINLCEIDFVSSAGLRALLKLSRWSQAEGILFAMTSLQAGVAKVFEIAAIFSSEQIFTNEDEALSALQTSNDE